MIYVCELFFEDVCVVYNVFVEFKKTFALFLIVCFFQVITVRARAAIPPVPLRKEIETITSYTKIDSSTIVAVQVNVLAN